MTINKSRLAAAAIAFAVAASQSAATSIRDSEAGDAGYAELARLLLDAG